ncbi:MAG: cation-translocating P-type ATPase [Sandaracinus sp.]|nr:cation-translocating P-type ATPase [Sandaracinus sp.]
MDTLRAARVVILDDGPRFLCSAACRDAFSRGERRHEPPPPTLERTRSIPERVRDATRPSIDLASRSTETADFSALGAVPRVPFPAITFAIAALAFVLAFFSRTPFVGIASAVLTGLAALFALVQATAVRREVGIVPWLVGPLGAILAGLGGLTATPGSSEAWKALAGGALAAAAMGLRAWLDARARTPVSALVQRLVASLPKRVRVPAEVAVDDARYEEVPVSRVRTGEEILAVEGEVVGVDGLVDAGEAWVLTQPGAQTPIRRGPGDPVLAGARVTEGALRLLVTRVGDDRALVRVGRFGAPRRDVGARVVKLAERVTRYGGFAVLVSAGLGLVLSDVPTLAGRLSAAAAVLIAAPLLGARRSAESPLVAAAAAAASRGIVYPDGRVLEDAGRVGAVAIATSGTVTEGRPEVVEVHVVGEGDEASLLALCAAAEASVEAHPIGRAIRRYVQQHHFPTRPVRRAQLHPGRGISALTPDGETFLVGNRTLLLEHGVSVALGDAEATRAEERGYTSLFVGLGGRVRAVLALRDDVRVGSRAAMQRFFDQRQLVVLVSGDHRATVEAVAKHLDVGLVKAELAPEERGDEVQRLGTANGLVAAVGCLGDDEALLHAADVPVVLGAAGSPQAERGVALTSDDLRDAAGALWIAQAARFEAVRGVTLSVVVGAPMLVGAALGWIGPGVAALVAASLDAFVLPAGARLLRRIELRVPNR